MRKKKLARIVCDIINGEHVEKYGFIYASHHESKWDWDVAYLQDMLDLPRQTENRAYFGSMPAVHMEIDAILDWFDRIKPVIENYDSCRYTLQQYNTYHTTFFVEWALSTPKIAARISVGLGIATCQNMIEKEFDFTIEDQS